MIDDLVANFLGGALVASIFFVIEACIRRKDAAIMTTSRRVAVRAELCRLKYWSEELNNLENCRRGTSFDSSFLVYLSATNLALGEDEENFGPVIADILRAVMRVNGLVKVITEEHLGASRAMTDHDQTVQMLHGEMKNLASEVNTLTSKALEFIKTSPSLRQ